MNKNVFATMENRMKQLLFVILLIVATPAIASQTTQQFCDSIAGNAQNMLKDVNSQDYANGNVTNDDLYTNYAGPRSQIGMDLILMEREILSQIIANRGKISAQDVNNYVYGRCENDYRQHQANYSRRY